MVSNCPVSGTRNDTAGLSSAFETSTVNSRFILKAFVRFAMASVGFGSMTEHTSHAFSLGCAWLKQIAAGTLSEFGVRFSRRTERPGLIQTVFDL
jgi:hypothetical protein